jgi:hypothetical protein
MALLSGCALCAAFCIPVGAKADLTAQAQFIYFARPPLVSADRPALKTAFCFLFFLEVVAVSAAADFVRSVRSVSLSARWSAPFPGEVARLARRCGAEFVGFRSSSRAFSRFVCVGWFPSESLAVGFAEAAVASFPLAWAPFAPFVVRPAGAWWVVSVPVIPPAPWWSGASEPLLVVRL